MRFVKRLCAVLIMAALFSCQFAFAEVPTSHVVANINGVQTLTETFTVDKSVEPKTLIYDELELDGWKYTFNNITQSSDPAKEELRNVSIIRQYQLSSQKESDAMTEAVKLMQGKIMAEDVPELAEKGLYGELYVVPGTLNVAPLNERTVYGTATVTKTYTYPYNENSQVPGTITDGGKDYSLKAVSWAEGELDPDNLLPKNYVATATYSRGTSSVKNDGYVATVEYSGNIPYSGLITYIVEYHGTEIVPEEIVVDEPDESEMRAIAAKNVRDKIVRYTGLAFLGLAGLAAIILLGVLVTRLFQSFVKINYRDEFSGQDKRLASVYLKKDMKINIDTAKHPECNHYTVILDKSKANRLTGKTLTITADLKVIEHTIGTCSEKQYEIPVSTEEAQIFADAIK